VYGVERVTLHPIAEAFIQRCGSLCLNQAPRMSKGFDQGSSVEMVEVGISESLKNVR